MSDKKIITITVTKYKSFKFAKCSLCGWRTVDQKRLQAKIDSHARQHGAVAVPILIDKSRDQK